MIINGKQIAKNKLDKIKALISQKNLLIQLDIILIGNDKSSKLFIQKKVEAGKNAGIKVVTHYFDENSPQESIIATCNKLNNNSNCNGFLVQLPIPKNFSKELILNSISNLKDVDCLSDLSLGKVISRPDSEKVRPATVNAIIEILKIQRTRLKGKLVAVINSSNLIGKPITAYLLKKGATVITCNSKTKNLKTITQMSDIIISATGKKHLILKEYVKKGALVIDCGTTFEGKKVFGDTDFTKIKEIASAVTPVPGGVGPITVACLFENLMILYKKQKIKAKNFNY